MNWCNYKNWLEEKLVLNLKPNSVIALDNASYYCCSLDERVPTSNFRKADMITWLQNNSIPYGADMSKPSLYKLVKQHKPKHLRCI